MYGGVLCGCGEVLTRQINATVVACKVFIEKRQSLLDSASGVFYISGVTKLIRKQRSLSGNLPFAWLNFVTTDREHSRMVIGNDRTDIRTVIPDCSRRKNGFC